MIRYVRTVLCTLLVAGRQLLPASSGTITVDEEIGTRQDVHCITEFLKRIVVDVTKWDH